MPRLFASLVLGAVLAGCGSQELRSPGCDLGQPAVVSGRILLSERFSEDDVSSMKLELIAMKDGVAIPLTSASLDEPRGYPIAFEVCSDLAGVDRVKPLVLRAIVRRAKVRGEPVQYAAGIQPEAIPTVGLDLWPLVQTCLPCPDPIACAATPCE